MTDIDNKLVRLLGLYSVKLAQSLTVTSADVSAELQQQDRSCMLNKPIMPSRKPYSQVLDIVRCNCELHDRHTTNNGHHYVAIRLHFVQALIFTDVLSSHMTVIQN